MRHILSLLLLCSALPLGAQQNLDSLKQVWGDSALPAEERLEALDEIIVHGQIQSYLDSMMHYAEQMIRFSQGNQAHFYFANGMLYKSFVLVSRGAIAEGKTLMDSSRRYSINHQDPWTKARATSLLGLVYAFTDSIEKALPLCLEAYEIMDSIADNKGLYETCINLGSVYSISGDIDNQINFTRKAYNYAEADDNLANRAQAYHSMADIFMLLEIEGQGDYYHEKALALSKKIGFIAEEMNIKGHLASMAYTDKEYDKALELLKDVEQWMGIQNSEVNQMNVHAKIIRTLTEKGDFQKAQIEIDFFNSNYTQTMLGGRFFMGIVELSEGIIAAARNNHREAVEKCKSALAHFERLGQFRQEQEACECIYTAYKAMGQSALALEYYEKNQEIETSLEDKKHIKNVQKFEFQKQMMADSLAKVEQDRALELAHQEDLRAQSRTKNIALGAGALFLLLAGGYYSRWRYVKNSQATLQKEKDRSDNLLLNILPEEIAEELKATGKANARDFDLVSILFTDFEDFTETSAKMDANQLVDEINYCFRGFDLIIEKYKIEKIKTIGDSYMAAGGLPVPFDDSVKNTVLAALELQDFIADRKTENLANGRNGFEMRVGIHTGPVVAGIVGVKKFQYDIWGDTVNTASRMESNGSINEVNISEATYNFIKADARFKFTKREDINVKGKGLMSMWFVSRAEG